MKYLEVSHWQLQRSHQSWCRTCIASTSRRWSRVSSEHIWLLYIHEVGPNRFFVSSLKRDFIWPLQETREKQIIHPSIFFTGFHQGFIPALSCIVESNFKSSSAHCNNLAFAPSIYSRSRWARSKENILALFQSRFWREYFIWGTKLNAMKKTYSVSPLSFHSLTSPQSE